MKKNNCFKTRESCKEFLDKFNFKYFIPYLEDFRHYNIYRVELNEDLTKVVYCCLEAIFVPSYSHCFYDCEREYNFELSKDGEIFRLEIKELDLKEYHTFPLVKAIYYINRRGQAFLM